MTGVGEVYKCKNYVIIILLIIVLSKSKMPGQVHIVPMKLKTNEDEVTNMKALP